ncbi:MAG: COX15/CtaA family protein [Candidatus Hydrogenedentota bacterium]
MNSPGHHAPAPWRRRFAVLTACATLLLIFAGSLVTSTGSALAVPDWPLAYGMLFPPMVGGVFYEHGHRIIASLVGFLTLILAVWFARTENRSWVRKCGWLALGAVIVQGLFGGMTVLFMQMQPLSIIHGVLAQSFFMLTILLAHSQSNVSRQTPTSATPASALRKLSFAAMAVIYIQLILGAVMRHTSSGLAIPDFPTMGGSWIPLFDDAMLKTISTLRFEANIDPPSVSLAQVAIHFAHRAGAVLVSLVVIAFLLRTRGIPDLPRSIRRDVNLLGVLLAAQVILGAFTIWSVRQPFVASFHVLTGATMLGLSTLLYLRSFPAHIFAREHLFPAPDDSTMRGAEPGELAKA